jgi:phosphate starvation-inducible PhoH-like protein
VQETLDVSNAVAAELAGISDGVLDALKERLGATVRLRGNQLTLEGDEAQIAEARTVIDEIVDLVEAGTQIGSHTVDAVLGTLAAGKDVREVFDAVVWRHRGKKIAPKTLTQKEYVDSIRRATVTFGIGPAGTGKTYLAMAKAVNALQSKQVDRIILTRPAVEAGERLGFLPGTLSEKIDPYLRPLYDALHDMMDSELIPKLMSAGVIEVAPLAYMRGRTLNNAFIILDEAQNTTAEQMKMFLTRLGFGSKIVVTGDITQVDLPGGATSGLRSAVRVLDGINDIHVSELTSADVVRHRLVSEIVDAYARSEEPTAMNRAERRAGPGRPRR